MKISQNGIDLIKKFEGCKLTSYPDVVGVWTIGYGTTSGVKSNQTITQEQAIEFLLRDLKKFEAAVINLVSVELNQNQFDALVCFVYNVGIKALTNSTLLKVLNKRNYTQAAIEFLRWNKAGGRIVSGLTRRRVAESQLFKTAIVVDNQ